MGKKIYITESQLNEIIGNSTYLNNQDTTNEYKLGTTEVSVNGITGDNIDGNLKTGKPVTTDKFAKQIKNQNRFGGYAPHYRRSILPESNQDLTGKNNTFQISDKEKKKIINNLNNYSGSGNEKGVQRMKNIINKNGRISYDDAYRILDDIESGNDGILDPDGTFKSELERKIKTGTDISANNRESKQNRGENIIKSAPKNYGNGKAHTPKGNNVINVTYE